MSVGLEELTQEQQDALAFQAYLDARKDDPLRYYRPNCKAAADMIRLAAEVVRIWVLTIFWRAGNSSGKTWNAAAMFVAISRGMKSLAGIPLPAIRVPNIGYVIPETKTRQIDSSQAAYQRWLGDHPHKIAWVQGETKGSIERIYVSTARCTHGMDAKCRTCSQIVFHSADSGPLEAVKVDWVHGDEIPPEMVWDSVTARFSVGQPFLLVITATPLYRRFWAWIAKAFKKQSETPGVIVDGKVELRSSILDNIFLPDEQAEALLAQWRDNPLERARIDGEYVDTEGDCPFDVAALQRWQKRAKPFKPERITIQAEQSFEDGRYFVDRTVEIEVFEPYIKGETYLAVWDPSSGIKSDAHDPAGGHIYRWASRPVLVLRFNGYLEPFGLGNLAVKLGERYGNALSDIDMTGGYGSNTVTAMSQKRYFNLVRDYHEDRPGVTSTRFGFTITAVNRSEITTAIERALLEDSVDMPSAAVIVSLLGVTVDAKNKWLAGPGRHDEDMICMGRALHLMSTLPAPKPRRQTGENRLRSMFGLSAIRRRPTAPTPRWNP